MFIENIIKTFKLLSSQPNIIILLNSFADFNKIKTHIDHMHNITIGSLKIYCLTNNVFEKKIMSHYKLIPISEHDELLVKLNIDLFITSQLQNNILKNINAKYVICQKKIMCLSNQKYKFVTNNILRLKDIDTILFEQNLKKENNKLNEPNMSDNQPIKYTLNTDNTDSNQNSKQIQYNDINITKIKQYSWCCLNVINFKPSRILIFSNIKFQENRINELNITDNDLLVFLNTATNISYFAQHKNILTLHRGFYDIKNKNSSYFGYSNISKLNFKGLKQIKIDGPDSFLSEIQINQLKEKYSSSFMNLSKVKSNNLKYPNIKLESRSDHSVGQHIF